MLLKLGAFKETYYKGIKEKAGYKLHMQSLDLLLPFLKKDFRILEFGCGEGAFSQRLTDLGYIVDACDIDVSQVKAKPNSIIQIDLNKENLSDNFNSKYDCVVAMEIIEHIENPWKFMRDISSLLKGNGIVLISTPNVANFASRIRFLMRGNLLGFEKENLYYGHITPITPFQLENLFSSTNYKTLTKKHVGVLPFFQFYDLSRFMLIRNLMLPLLYLLMGGEKKGLCTAFILQKT